MLDTNRALLRDFLRSRDDLDYFWPEYGTVVFPKLKSGSVNELCELLRIEFETTVVPGHFFECPDHFRMGVGMATETVSASLQQLALGMDRYRLKAGGVAPAGARSAQ